MKSPTTSLPENHSTKPGPMRCKALAGALSKEFMGATSTWWDYLWRNFTECLSISVGSQQLQVRRAKPRASTRVVGNKQLIRPAYFFPAGLGTTVFDCGARFARRWY